jgi:hypothetical protein
MRKITQPLEQKSYMDEENNGFSSSIISIGLMDYHTGEPASTFSSGVSPSLISGHSTLGRIR